MPPRRSHKKSRAGCQRCKARKIKCDEVHPLCGNCEKHGVTCDFDGTAPCEGSDSLRRDSTEEDSLVKSPSASSTNSSLIPFFGSLESGVFSKYSGTSRILELRLLHNYTTLTSKTLAAANSPQMEEAWTVSVPMMAFESPCLMDAILAVSALHMRATNPTDQSLIRASHGYMASAIHQYSSALMQGVDGSNAEALFTTSALIAFQASASRRFQDDSEEKYSLPVQWFHSFQGIKTVVLASWKYIRESERVKPIITAQPALMLDLNPKRPAFFSPLLEGLDEALLKFDEKKRVETRQAYEHAVAFINWSHQKPERSRILGFPATVSRRFVELIEMKDPRTLVIIACFFAMTKAVDNVWWLEGIAKQEVNGIMSILPLEWWPKMQWALNVACHDSPMDEQTWGDCWHFEGNPSPSQGFNGDIHSHIDILAQVDSTMPEST